LKLDSKTDQNRNMRSKEMVGNAMVLIEPRLCPGCRRWRRFAAVTGLHAQNTNCMKGRVMRIE